LACCCSRGGRSCRAAAHQTNSTPGLLFNHGVV
jgi:hypothetical protein